MDVKFNVAKTALQTAGQECESLEAVLQAATTVATELVDARVERDDAVTAREAAEKTVKDARQNVRIGLRGVSAGRQAIESLETRVTKLSDETHAQVVQLTADLEAERSSSAKVSAATDSEAAGLRDSLARANEQATASGQRVRDLGTALASARTDVLALRPEVARLSAELATATGAVATAVGAKEVAERAAASAVEARVKAESDTAVAVAAQEQARTDVANAVAGQAQAEADAAAARAAQVRAEADAAAARSGGGSSSGDAAVSMQLAAERRTVRRLNAAIRRSEGREEVLVTGARQRVLDAQDELLPKVDDVFEQSNADDSRLAGLYEVIESAFATLADAIQSLRRGTKRERDD